MYISASPSKRVPPGCEAALAYQTVCLSILLLASKVSYGLITQVLKLISSALALISVQSTSFWAPQASPGPGPCLDNSQGIQNDIQGLQNDIQGFQSDVQGV